MKEETYNDFMNSLPKISVIGLSVDVATYESALNRCLELTRRPGPAAVSAANTHIATAARLSSVFGRVMAAFDLILPDGMPLVWVMNAKLRHRKQAKLEDRVYGPYFMRHALLHAPANTTHYFFGGSQECLDELSAAVRVMRPDIRIVGVYSPPYRAWDEADQQEFARQINAASPDFVWVALGGEKQEAWIVDNLHRFKRGVFFAVGDAFELLAGRRDFAPDWIQRHGVTWLYRLLQEPRRMWKRYFKYNSLFLGYLLKDLLFPQREVQTTRAKNESISGSRVNILGVGVNATSMDDVVMRLIEARGNGESGYVCVTGAHGIMESQRDEELRQIHNRSLMTVPDGMPTVWIGHEYGFVKMGRVYGPDLMLALCAETSGVDRCSLIVDKDPQKNQQPNTSSTAEMSFTHFLYGSTEETLRKLKENLEKKFPGLQIVGTYAPPFRPLTQKEERELQEVVVKCKPDFFWVGLSTPKQEKFMAAHAPLAQNDPVDSCSLIADRDSLSTNNQQPTTDAALNRDLLDCGVMLGVGAAFDIHAGNMKDSPEWVKNAGLQWLHRLCKEPRRLWRRYLWIVPGFAWLTFLQVMGLRRFALEDRDQKSNIRGRTAESGEVFNH
jgi:N-acetylglucosaminyldiphosphoundecaprenol N-acetyl-beta-D-mannosaminyltransferase